MQGKGREEISLVGPIFILVRGGGGGGAIGREGISS